jgi:hypothetical protein
MILISRGTVTGCVHLPASCDLAIRRLCFDFDIGFRAINLRDKESFIQREFLGGIQ